MTVRPRYTYRAKARDLTTAYVIVWRALTPALIATTRAFAGGARRLLATRYTDPEDPR
ncbi:hypothetical protein [Brachybacterium sp. GU-2]|uniref:hypothetical protein n=1 Tax=Brachybacterium sp. GU-2 TaxID=3069708 RepID=UPI00280A7B15|nr:hypothetical protein [Brachybacterium sp. GU-2]WME22133.1 hypothetical protein RBL05_11365 [Brachybacterium sp. GU-2]